jgi:hypothetical protein
MYWFMKFDTTQVLFPFFFQKIFHVCLTIFAYLLFLLRKSGLDQLVHCDMTHYRSQEHNFLPDLGVFHILAVFVVHIVVIIT